MERDFKYPILICFGTRPEWLKIAPITKQLKKEEYKLLFTGQHTDLLKDVQADYTVHIKSNEVNRLNKVISTCLEQFPSDKFSGVLVQGDTASAVGCALAAFNLGIKVFYLEAGLRTFNLQHPFPEEGYRQIISRISYYNFTPTEISNQNLIREKVIGKRSIVGNSILDNLIDYKTQEASNIVLVTLHRRENHDQLHRWFEELEKLAIEYDQLQFILPLHPNPAVQKHKNTFKKVTLVDPIPYEEFLTLLAKCKLVITDSGGIQEEGSFFNKTIIVCREYTERPEGLKSGHSFLCKTPTNLQTTFKQCLALPQSTKPCPYGDGNTAKRVVRILRKELF